MTDAADYEEHSVSVTKLHFTPQIVAVLVIAAFGWAVTYMSIRADIGSKAPATAVDDLKMKVDANTAVLHTLQRRGKRVYCATFPQSFECQPDEIDLP